jgi:hypothetical protein
VGLDPGQVLTSGRGDLGRAVIVVYVRRSVLLFKEFIHLS